jgi:acyl-CoA synthetase (AMP-forming)/AMP-acid ligase II
MAKEYRLNDELKAAKKNQDPEDCTLVVWTGGTTGFPKAVELSHINIIEMCLIEYNTLMDFFIDRGFMKEDEHPKWLINLPVSHVGGTVELLGTGIIGGAENIVQASWSPWDSLKAMQKYNINVFGGVPTMFKIYLSLPDLDIYEPKKYLKLAILSGEKVPFELLKG